MSTIININTNGTTTALTTLGLPDSSTDNEVVVFDGTSGNTIASGHGVTIDPSGNMAALNSATFKGGLVNPGGAKTLWVDNSSGHLMLGSADIQADSGGDVFGPASSIDNTIPRFDGISGKTLQASGVTLDDSGNIYGVRSIALAATASNPGADNTIWHDSTTGRLMLGSFDPVTSAFESVSLEPAAANPGDDSTLWIDSATGHLMRGTTDLEAGAASGDVVGPAIATDNAVARFDTTSGKAVQNSTVLLDDNGNLADVRSATLLQVAANPGGANTLWINSATGKLMRGATQVESTGDVVGPASSTANALARFSGITGKIIHNSAITQDDNGNLGGVRSANFTSVAANPGGTSTLWVSSATGNLMRGSVNIEAPVKMFCKAVYYDIAGVTASIPTDGSNYGITAPTLTLTAPNGFFSQPSSGVIMFLGTSTKYLRITLQISFSLSSAVDTTVRFGVFASGVVTTPYVLQYASGTGKQETVTVTTIASVSPNGTFSGMAAIPTGYTLTNLVITSYTIFAEVVS